MAESNEHYLEAAKIREKIKVQDIISNKPLKINDIIVVEIMKIFPLGTRNKSFYLIYVDPLNIYTLSGVKILGYDSWTIVIDFTADGFLPVGNYLNVSGQGRKDMPKGCTLGITKRNITRQKYLPPFSPQSLLDKDEKTFHFCKADRKNPENNSDLVPLLLATRVLQIDNKRKEIILGLRNYYKNKTSYNIEFLKQNNQYWK